MLDDYQPHSYVKMDEKTQNSTIYISFFSLSLKISPQVIYRNRPASGTCVVPLLYWLDHCCVRAGRGWVARTDRALTECPAIPR